MEATAAAHPLTLLDTHMNTRGNAVPIDGLECYPKELKDPGVSLFAYFLTTISITSRGL